MKYKTLVRVGLRLFGVFFCSLWLSRVANRVFAAISPVVIDWLGQSQSGFVMPGSALVWGIGSETGTLLIGLVLFLGSGFFANLVIPSNRPYCLDCGYELTASPPEGCCPECGAPYRKPASWNDGAAGKIATVGELRRDLQRESASDRIAAPPAAEESA